MNKIDAALEDLRGRREQIDRAIAALEVLNDPNIAETVVKSVPKATQRRKEGLSYRESQVAEFVRLHPEGVIRNQISECVNIPGNSVGSILDRLEKNGIVRIDRTVNPYRTFLASGNDVQIKRSKKRQSPPNRDAVIGIQNHLRDHPGSTVNQIRTSLGFDFKRVDNWLRRGEKVGRFVCDRTTHPMSWSLGEVQETNNGQVSENMETVLNARYGR